jgi:hypothetical protein
VLKILDPKKGRSNAGAHTLGRAILYIYELAVAI